jgi:signal transduction histidine kinase
MSGTTQATPLSDLSSWEKWSNWLFAWTPYVTLAVGLVLSQVVARDVSDRLVLLALVVGAGVWTWFTFTRQGLPTEVGQGSLRVYFVGFAVVALLLISRETVFLVYGISGFFHASLLRPWPLAFAGVGVAGFVVHSHIVFADSSATAWLIYLGVVALQTVAVFVGLYGGHKITEVADERRRTVDRLETTMAENAGLHAQLVAQAHEAGILDERQRMAREIHDTIAQGLTGVITQIEAAQQSWEDERETRRHLGTAADIARQSLDEARRSVRAIRPGSLTESRLPDALASVVERWAEVSGVAGEMRTTGTRRPLHPDTEVTLLRAAQEGLANAGKHAHASRVGVTLTFMDSLVSLDIRDDGVGFDPETTRKADSYGLAAMRQRVENSHGEMHIESTPGEGTAISVRIPTSTDGQNG